MSPQTRRQFFEESLIAAAAASVGISRPEAHAEETKRPSPNDVVRHAVIGCRIRGRVHAQTFGSVPGVEIACVCDPDRQLAEELATAVEKKSGRRPKVIQDLRVIFEDPAVDTVSIAAPNHWHALAAIWAMQAGKDVYVEKPVSKTVAEGRRMVQVARKTGRICQGGTQNRSSGAIAAAADYVRSGKLGKITLCRTLVYSGRGPIGSKGVYEVPAGVDFNLWLGPGMQETLTRPNLHYDWHWVWDTGNGELGNNNIHYIDIVRWVAGLNGLGESVISIGGRLGYEDAGETPNTQIVVHKFGPTTVIQEVRGLKTPPFSDKFKSGWVVEGTEGFIAGESRFDREGNLVETFTGKTDNHFANFIQAVRSRRREDLRAEIAEGHQSTALCHLGNISYRLGRTAPASDIVEQLRQHDLGAGTVDACTRMIAHLGDNRVDLKSTPLTIGPLLRLDSAKEEFVNQPAANGLLACDCRRPFVVPGEREI